MRGPERPTLGTASLHVWSVRLDRLEATVSQFHGLLSPDERVRAARFRFRTSRDRYVVGRGALRTLLSRYLDCPPASIELRAGPHGKPMLASGSPALHFNVSHSEGLALVALTLRAELGVDVEYIQRAADLEALAERFFSPLENRQLRALSPRDRTEAFYQCWTRKEAVIKATGEGLSRPLDSFDVVIGPERPPRLLRLDGEPDAARTWMLYDLRPAEGFAGAIAIPSRDLEIARWHYQ